MPGHYPINPDRKAPWNDLPLLPIHKSYLQSPEVLQQLADSKHALGMLQGRSVVIPNQGLLVNTISLQEAKDSSEIENIFTTNDELYKAFSESNPGEEEGPAKEVLHYREALWTGWNELRAGARLDSDLAVRIFREVKQTNEGIRPPFAQTYIVQGGSGPNAGQPIYTPPRGKGILEDKLENLWHFLADHQAFPVDPLIKMAIGHLQFEAIHPFRDGNGRTGRILNILYLSQQGLLEYPILYLSRYILAHKANYYSLLADVTQRGKWEDWILYMLKAIGNTASYTYGQINRIMAAKADILHALEEDPMIRKPEQLAEALFLQPYTQVKPLTKSGLFAENTARKYLDRLAEMGIVDKRIIKGHHYYLNLELYHILTS